MLEYRHKAWLYAAAVISLTAAILYFRSEVYNVENEWSKAASRDTACAYREYCVNWRGTHHVADAYKNWERLLTREREQLDLLSPSVVRAFIKDHPEFCPEEILLAHYRAVVGDGRYESLKGYLDYAREDDPHRKAVCDRIDALVMKEVQPAIDADDYQTLKQLEKKYSLWPKCYERISRQIVPARENTAKREWFKIANSRSELELKGFASKFSGTEAASNAKKKIDELYDDFDFVKAKGTLKAYCDFVKRNPVSSQINMVKSAIADELEGYVFRRKSMEGGDESLVRSCLAEYKQSDPPSGILYGGGGYSISPFKITTPGYSGDNYFVKLVNKRTGSSVGIFVRSGATTEVLIPDGTYSVRYATGRQWYGTRYLFGLDASYCRANQDFTFSDGSGYSLTLMKVVNGNLHTSSMSAEDF